MSSPFGTNNPGIGGLNELTNAEEAVVAAMLPLGSAGQILAVAAGGTSVEWVTAAGTGDMLASTYDPGSVAEQLVGLTATQTLTNKTLTSAVLNTGVSGTAVLDEDNMASDSATQLATQQSIKAYVDSQVPSTESIQDIVGAMFSGNTETGITVTYQDADGTIDLVADVTSQLTQEEVEDYAGALVATGGTKTGITVTYQDATGDMDFVVSDLTVAGDSGSTGMTPGDTLTVAGGVGITTAMSGDTLTITNTVTQLTQEEVEDYAGALVATGGTKTGITVTYQDSTGDMDFVVDSASTTQEGISERATDAEFTTGTDTTRYVTADQVQGVTQTMNNKRVVPRIGTTASGATITPTGDDSDQYNVTALATAATIAAPSGTPNNGQRLVLRILDNGTARALTWNAIYRVIGTTLPTTTVISKTMYIGLIYNSADTKWDVVAVAEEA